MPIQITETRITEHNSAESITFSPPEGIESTNVQDAIEELVVSINGGAKIIDGGDPLVDEIKITDGGDPSST